MNFVSFVRKAATLVVVLVAATGVMCVGQQPQLMLLNSNRSTLDAHNCYPYDGRWSDRIERALKLGFPVGIEQDLAWATDLTSGQEHVVVAHSEKTTGREPSLRDYFFERVRPIVEKALAENDRSRWPLIIVHFDIKDNRPALLHALWDLLGQYEGWISTAEKTGDAHEVSPIDVKPLLVLTEDSDAQQRVFFDELSKGARLRLFGSAHTQLTSTNRQEHIQLEATLAPTQLLPEPATNYRRWWNNPWYEVEEGGQHNAGPWTAADDARLRSLVDHAHQLGYWIRFYTLDGFTPEKGQRNGWFDDYNFGSAEAARIRWQACIRDGVNLIATDDYEGLARVLEQNRR